MMNWLLDDETYTTTSAAIKGVLPPGMYTPRPSPVGLEFVPTPFKADGIINLQDAVITRVISGVRNFWESRETFLALGLLHKRGVLLYGKPGCGKSACIETLSKDVIDGDGIVLLCDHPVAALEGVREIRKVEPNARLVVVMEDIDTWIEKRNYDSMLSNLLDGAGQTDGVVYVATTNHIEKIPAQFRNRPSRFDEVVEVAAPSTEMRYQYLRHKIPAAMLEDHVLRGWADQTEGLTIAHMRELIVGVVALHQPFDEVVHRLQHMQVSAKADSGEIPMLIGKAEPTGALTGGFDA
jgi:SpoVK/Ycf46/Vps4 family AAA+-type ATPase